MANEYSVFDSFHNVKESFQQYFKLYIATLEVVSLFTNTPLDETTEISIDKLYNGNENPPKIPRYDFRDLLNIAIK